MINLMCGFAKTLNIPSLIKFTFYLWLRIGVFVVVSLLFLYCNYTYYFYYPRCCLPRSSGWVRLTQKSVNFACFTNTHTHTPSMQCRSACLDAKMIARTRLNTGGYDNCWCVNNYWVPLAGASLTRWMLTTHNILLSNKHTTQCSNNGGQWEWKLKQPSVERTSEKKNGIHAFRSKRKTCAHNLELNLFYLLFNVAIRHAGKRYKSSS